jgi:hypothetical protein
LMGHVGYAPTMPSLSMQYSKTMVHYRYIIPEQPSFKNFNKLSKSLKCKFEILRF